MPTIGYEIETTHVKDLTLISGDVGGADKLRPLWRHYFQNASGIIFVVDCRNHERLEQVAEELIRIFSEVVLNGVPFLIFANKQDLKGALTPYQLACELGLRNPLMNDPIQMESKIRNNLALHFEGRHWCIQPSCAISGVGLQEGIHWLASATHK
uniref:ADP-ribosylation factor n=1 Tax=Arcella intermedia TaxID=1963864 RepID=A0A6B2LJA3_9EUKA